MSVDPKIGYSLGFGRGPFGRGPFGRSDWCFQVLYLDLPQEMIKQDQAEGGYYEKFVRAASVPLDRLRKLIRNFDDHLRDPILIRQDLLEFYSIGFGLEMDPELREDVRRMRVDIWSRFRLIKGTEQCFVVLARIHGFEATVEELWWNGTSYLTTQPFIDFEFAQEVP